MTEGGGTSSEGELWLSDKLLDGISSGQGSQMPGGLWHFRAALPYNLPQRGGLFLGVPTVGNLYLKKA